jgi:hypothetical protein
MTSEEISAAAASDRSAAVPPMKWLEIVTTANQSISKLGFPMAEVTGAEDEITALARRLRQLRVMEQSNRIEAVFRKQPDPQTRRS